MAGKPNEVSTVVTQASDATVDIHRMKSMFKQMKSYLRCSEKEIAALNNELSRRTLERNDLIEQLKNKELQMNMYQERDLVQCGGKGLIESSEFGESEQYHDSQQINFAYNSGLANENIALTFKLQAVEKELEQCKEGYEVLKLTREELFMKLERKEQEIDQLKRDKVSFQIEVERKENKIQILEAKVYERNMAPNLQNMNDFKRREDDSYRQDWMKLMEETMKDKDRRLDKLSDELKGNLSNHLLLKEKCSTLTHENKMLLLQLQELQMKAKAGENEGSFTTRELKGLGTNNMTSCEIKGLEKSLMHAEIKGASSVNENQQLRDCVTKLERYNRELEMQRENDKMALETMLKEKNTIAELLRKTERINADLECNLRETEDKNSEVVKELVRKKSILEKLQVEYNSLLDQTEKINEKKSKADFRGFDETDKMNDELRHTNEQLSHEREVLQKRVHQLIDEAQMLKIESEYLREENESINRQLSSCVSGWEEENRQCDTDVLEKSTQKVKSQSMGNGNSISKVSKQLKCLRGELTEAKSECLRLEEEVACKSKKIQELQDINGTLDQKCYQCENVILTLQESLQEKFENSELADQKHLMLMQEYAEVQQQCQELENELQNTKGWKNEHNNICEALKTAHEENNALRLGKVDCEETIKKLQYELKEREAQENGQCDETGAKDQLVKEVLNELKKREEWIDEKKLLSAELNESKTRESKLNEKLAKCQRQLAEKIKKFKAMKKLEKIKEDTEVNCACKDKSCCTATEDRQVEIQKLTQQHMLITEANQMLSREKLDVEEELEKMSTALSESEKCKEDLNDQFNSVNEKYQELLHDALALKNERDELSELAHTEKNNRQMLENKVNELSEKLKDVQQQLQERLEENVDLSESLSTTQGNLTELKETLKDHKNQIQAYKRAHQDLHSKYKDNKLNASKQIVMLRDTVSKQADESSAVKKALDEAKTEIQQYEMNLCLLRQASRELCLKNKDLTKCSKIAESRIQELEGLNECGKEEIRELSENLHSVTICYNSMKQEKHEMKTLLDFSEGEIKRLQVMLESAEHRRLFLENQREKNKKELASLEREKQELTKKLDAFKKIYHDQQKKMHYLASKIKKYQMKSKEMDQNNCLSGKEEALEKADTGRQYLSTNEKGKCSVSGDTSDDYEIRTAFEILHKLDGLLSKKCSELNSVVAKDQPPYTFKEQDCCSMREQYNKIAAALSIMSTQDSLCNCSEIAEKQETV